VQPVLTLYRDVRLELCLDVAMAWETPISMLAMATFTEAFREALAASEQAGSEFEQARAHYRLRPGRPESSGA
jgi:hypothetical protein